MTFGDYDLLKYSIPVLWIPVIGDGLDMFIRSQLYKNNTKTLNEFRNELKKFNHSKPDYGFILPTYKNPEELDKCLDNLLNELKIPKTEIIAVDDFSNDNGRTKRIATEKYGIETLEVSKEEKDVRKIRAQRKGTAKWLERGKKYVICMDSDSYIRTDKNNLELAMAEMDFFNLDAMAGQVLPKIDKNSTLLERIQFVEYKQAMRSGRGSMYSLKKNKKQEATSLDDLKDKYSLKQASQLCVSGAFGIFKPDSLKQVLDEAKVYGGGEDTEITLRLLAKKAKIGYNNDLVVETEAPKNLSSWFRQRDFWSQFITTNLFDSGYAWNIFKKKDSKWKPNYDAGGLSLRVNMIRDVYMHPLKMASIPFLIANLPVLAAFMATYSGMELYNSNKIKEKEEKTDLAAELLIPFYRLGQLVGPTTVGYAKQFGRIFNFKERKKNKK